MASEEDARKLSKEQVDELLGSEDGTGKIKTLIVEDEHTTQLLYDKGLFSQIFEKKLVASGKEALQVYAEWHPDIIILDIYLPEMTGYDLLKSIRTTIKDKKTTIVMATSLSGTDDVMSCMKLGIEGYIVKPFSVQDISTRILSCYAKKKPQRAQKADVLCREILQQSQVRWLLEKDKPKAKEESKAAAGDTSDPAKPAAGGAKEAATAPAEKPKV